MSKQGTSVKPGGKQQTAASKLYLTPTFTMVSCLAYFSILKMEA
jgi:hypothetical protein